MRSHPATALVGYPALDDASIQQRAEAFRLCMSSRRTVREFSDRAVPRGVVEAALLTAASAPSGANHQPWFFCVLEDRSLRQRIRLAAEVEEQNFYAHRAPQEWLDALAPLGTNSDKAFLETAPVLIAVFGQNRGGPQPGDDKKNYYVTQSVGIATGFLLVALHHAGLASLTHTPAPMNFLTELCGRPDHEKPFLLVVAGHPASGATVPVAALDKKRLGEVASWL